MFYGLDLDLDMLWIQNDWIRNPFQQMPGFGMRFCAAGFALLNLPKGKSLGRSKPETNSSNEQAH